MNRKNVAILMAAVVAIALFSVRNPVESMLEIERQLTTSPYYDRNPSFFIGNDGTWWVFFARASSALPHVPPAYNPDVDSYDIYYLRSTDAGINWTVSNIPASIGDGVSQFTPAAFQDTAGKIWVFFAHNAVDIKYFTSTNNGSTWTGPTAVGVGGGFTAKNHVDAIQTSDGKIWIFFWCSDAGGNKLCSMNTPDGGTTWSGVTNLNPGGVVGGNVPKAIEASPLRVVWASDAGDPYLATYDGTSWTAGKITAADTAYFDFDPVLVKYYSTYYLFWAPWDAVTDSQWIEYISSSDLTTWSSSTILTSGGYGATYWWDYYPDASLDPWGNILFFYSSEKSSDGTTRTDGNIWMFRSPIPRYRADTNKPMMPRASNTINGAKDLMAQADDLLKQAQDKGLDTAACEKIIDEAKELLELADKFFSGGNYIAANNFALKALDKYKDAVECLEELLG
ncbi:MAG: hypothetical protein ACE5K0_10835 [Candidatus Methanofastidiosia archaeon]